MSGLRVLNPGLFTSVQDRGRIGFRDIGVPTSGVLDLDAMRLANALAGNDPDCAVLECLGMGPEIEAVDGPVRVAFIGEADATILRSDGARQALGPAHSATLGVGDRLAMGALRTACASIAVEGGVDVPMLLGSRATYVRGGFGGYSGRTLRQGDVVPVGIPATSRAEQRLTADWRGPADDPIRVVLGPQDDAFTNEGVATFLGEPYAISNNADRMGYRFEGSAIAHVKGADIVSDGAVAGSIQVPGSGQPIVLLADGQSVGGYTKIATVISTDLPRLVRKQPGMVVRFAAVSQGQAKRSRVSTKRGSQPRSGRARTLSTASMCGRSTSAISSAASSTRSDGVRLGSAQSRDVSGAVPEGPCAGIDRRTGRKRLDVSPEGVGSFVAA